MPEHPVVPDRARDEVADVRLGEAVAAEARVRARDLHDRSAAAPGALHGCQRNRRGTCRTPGVRSGGDALVVPLPLAVARPSLRPAVRRANDCHAASRGVGVGAGILIPLVIKAVIDGPVADGDSQGLLPLGLLALGLGLCSRRSLAFCRRLTQSARRSASRPRSATTSTPTCSACRSRSTTRWQSGQLLSRATTDLSRDPPVPRLRPGVLRRQHRHVPRRLGLLIQLYAPLGFVVAVSADPARLDVAALRARLPRRLPAGAGPAGRPRHARRGVAPRHPRHQGVRPARHMAAQFATAPSACTTPSIEQGPAASPTSGRCSTWSRA